MSLHSSWGIAHVASFNLYTAFTESRRAFMLHSQQCQKILANNSRNCTVLYNVSAWWQVAETE